MWSRRDARIRWSSALAVAMVLAACGGATPAETATAPDDVGTAEGAEVAATGTGQGGSCAVDGELRPTSILLPFPFAVPFFSIYVAQARGYFEEEGLDVEVNSADGSATVVQQVVADRVEFGMSDPGPIIDAVALGEDLVVPYVYQTGLIYGLVVQEGAPYESVTDLAGETVGVSEATAGEVPFLEALLATNGVDPDTDATIIEVGGGGPAAVALERGSVAAYFSDYFNLIELGFEVPLEEFDLGEFGLLHAASLVVAGDLAEDDPAVVACVTRAMARASEFTHASPEAAIIEIGTAFPDQVTDPEGFDLTAIEETIRRTQPYEESDQMWGFNRAESWQGYIDLLSARGELTDDIDPTSLYTNDFIESANDFDKESEAAAAESVSSGG